jgi:ketosteroid isomerase-like protein
MVASDADRADRAAVTLSADDRLDIFEVLTQADSAATSRDADAYVALFTDDAVLDGGMGEHRGKSILQQSVGPIWQAEGKMSVHLTLNAVVRGVEGQPDHAVATSVLLILTGVPVTSIHSVSSIVQHLVKKGTEWQIEHRSVRLL